MKHAAGRIVARLRSAGHEAWLVGGCVRDLLLGREPKDHDVATSATPDQVSAMFPRTVGVGRAFGVVLVIDGDQKVEVATFRTESGYSDGRRPDEVAFSDARQDVLRRDFTVNGLLYDPVTEEVVDHVDGRADLEARLIRTIGEPHERFGEDALRLLRAVRFAAALEFDFEPGTWRALCELAPTIERISAERVRDELLVMFTGGHGRRGVELLSECGLLEAILPEVAAMRGVEQPPQFHPEGDVFLHTMLMLGGMDELVAGGADIGFPFAMAVLLHDVGKPVTQSFADRIRFDGHAARGGDMAADICRRLRVSARDCALVKELVGDHMRFTMVRRMRQAKLKRFFARESFPMHLDLHRLDCSASHGELETYEFCRLGYEEFLKEEAERTEPLLTGRDIVEMGYAEGPVVGEILTAIEDARFEGSLGSAGDARDFVRERFPQDGAEAGAD